MRDISMERVNATRKEMLNTVKSPTLTHEQKVATMANLADSMLEVLDLPEGLDELLNQPIDKQCICDLSEGHAPLRSALYRAGLCQIYERGKQVSAAGCTKGHLRGDQFPTYFL